MLFYELKNTETDLFAVAGMDELSDHLFQFILAQSYLDPNVKIKFHFLNQLTTCLWPEIRSSVSNVMSIVTVSWMHLDPPGDLELTSLDSTRDYLLWKHQCIFYPNCQTVCLSEKMTKLWIASDVMKVQVSSSVGGRGECERSCCVTFRELCTADSGG